MFDRIEYYAEQLQADPVSFIIYMCYYVVVILLSLILHECAHGWMANRCGDPTAKMLGRLSLNPARHLDPLGTLCMFLLGFGWAKPVPVNPRNFQNYRRDDFLVSIAGVTVNLTLFITCTAISALLNPLILGERYMTILEAVYSNGPLSFASPFYMDGYNIIHGDWAALATDVQETFRWLVYGDSNVSINSLLGVAETPMTNAEGWAVLKEFLALPELFYVQRFLLLMAQANVSLALFNLLPIPPLDGYHVLNDTILRGKLKLNTQLFRITQIVLIVIMLSGAFDSFLSDGVVFVHEAVLKTFLKLTGQM